MQFPKGHIPWNKGKKGSQVAWNKGKKCPQFSGENNPLFGKPRPESVKRKIRNKLIGRKWPPGSRKRNYEVGNLASNWRGGRIKTIHGYVLIHYPSHPLAAKSGYVPEHRLVVERIIGRCLDKENQVHHMGDRDNNHPTNLIAFITNGAHRRFEFGKEVYPEEIIFDGRTIRKEKQNGSEANGKSTISNLESALNGK